MQARFLKILLQLKKIGLAYSLEPDVLFLKVLGSIHITEDLTVDRSFDSLRLTDLAVLNVSEC